jgi:DNA-binding response OmpR family regulator
MTATILICDNEEPLRALVRASLDGDGHELLEARDGDEALALAREARPDLIVLDMMMPGRTGIDVLRDLRADPSFADTSVIMLTARAQVADRAAAAEAGADRFLAKPFSPLELGALVDELLSSRS